MFWNGSNLNLIGYIRSPWTPASKGKHPSRKNVGFDKYNHTIFKQNVNECSSDISTAQAVNEEIKSKAEKLEVVCHGSKDSIPD